MRPIRLWDALILTPSIATTSCIAAPLPPLPAALLAFRGLPRPRAWSRRPPHRRIATTQGCSSTAEACKRPCSPVHATRSQSSSGPLSISARRTMQQALPTEATTGLLSLHCSTCDAEGWLAPAAAVSGSTGGGH